MTLHAADACAATCGRWKLQQQDYTHYISYSHRSHRSHRSHHSHRSSRYSHHRMMMRLAAVALGLSLVASAAACADQPDAFVVSGAAAGNGRYEQSPSDQCNGKPVYRQGDSGALFQPTGAYHWMVGTSANAASCGATGHLSSLGAGGDCGCDPSKCVGSWREVRNGAFQAAPDIAVATVLDDSGSRCYDVDGWNAAAVTATFFFVLTTLIVLGTFQPFKRDEARWNTMASIFTVLGTIEIIAGIVLAATMPGVPGCDGGAHAALPFVSIFLGVVHIVRGHRIRGQQQEKLLPTTQPASGQGIRYAAVR